MKISKNNIYISVYWKMHFFFQANYGIFYFGNVKIGHYYNKKFHSKDSDYFCKNSSRSKYLKTLAWQYFNLLIRKVFSFATGRCFQMWFAVAQFKILYMPQYKQNASLYVLTYISFSTLCISLDHLIFFHILLKT